MRDVYIVDALRTAVGKFGGTLAPLGAVELGSTVVRELLERNSLTGEEADELLMGCVLQAGLGQNVARQVALAAGIPREKPSLTVNMVCGSGLKTVALAAGSVKAGDADLVLAGGTESMSGAPYLSREARFGGRMGNLQLIDSMICDGLWDVFNDYHMGMTAENLADRYEISREEQDAFAAASQNRAQKALDEGRFREEIVDVAVPRRKMEPLLFHTDEYIRRGVTAEGLAKMKPAFRKNGSVTAANASGINDGAAAVIVAGGGALKRYGLTPMARIASYAACGNDPAFMGVAPVEAVKLALKRAGWTMGEVELIEANEAFAVQALALMRETGMNPGIVNVNGGAIAIGHPIGASGARILTTLLYEMRRRGVRKGLATLCIGGGMGIAMCLETG